MAKRFGFPAVVVAVVCALPAAAWAADIPIKAPPRAVVQQTGNYYIWVDGSYQSVGLPTYDLGFKRLSAGTFLNQGPLESHNPKAKGWGVSGGVGFILPSGTRLELGGSFVQADASQSGSSFIPGTGGVFLQNLNGGVVVSAICGFVAGCGTSSTLKSDFDAWSVNLKASRDIVSGNFVLSPSGMVFGGRASNDQVLAQTHNHGFIPGNSSFYDARSSLDWTDVGVKAGLDATLNLSSTFAIGAGGTIGVAYRSASLSANDICTSGGFVVCAAPSSSLSASATRAPFLGNAEARLIYRPTSNVAIRGFGGMNYDSSVPGISASTFSTTVVPLVGPPNNQGPGSGIKFSSETSWYAGGGVLVKFGP